MHVPSLPGLLMALIAGLLLFGTKRLPEMGASIGQGIREFKKSLHEIASGPTTPDVRRSIDTLIPSPAAPRRLAAPTTSNTEGYPRE